MVVPSFNLARFLPNTLDSILEQDHQHFEIIVVDGASTDGSVDILRAYSARHPQVRWISEPDEGPADAVNKGLALTRGVYIGIQNADDVYRPGALTAAVRAFRDNPGCSFIYGDVEFIDAVATLRRTRRFPDFSWSAFLAWSCTFAQSSIFFRQSAMQKIGGWNPNYYSCDLDYWLRLAFLAPPVHVPAVLSGWRLHAGQRTRPEQYRRICADYGRMIRESPEMQRSSRRLRRWARASHHLLMVRFPPEAGAWKKLLNVAIGIGLHPAALRYNPWQRFARALPGARSLRALRHRKAGSPDQ